MTGKRAREKQVERSRRDRVFLRVLREAAAPYEPPVPCPVCGGKGKRREGGCELCGVTR